MVEIIKRINKKMMKILNFFAGYKTFIIALCAIVWGIHTGDQNLVFTGLGFAGIRQAMAMPPQA